MKWKFFRDRVQHTSGGQFLSGRAIVVGAGPPNIGVLALENLGDVVASSGTELVFLVGMVQQMSIAQAANVQRLFEIGSIRQYFITGHTLTTIQLNKVMFHGPNLLRTLYAYYSSSGDGAANFPALMARYANTLPAGVNAHTVINSPGEANLFSNLGSDLFSQPFGLLFMVRDQNEFAYGAMYAENCHVDNHVMATDSTSILMTETVNIQAERIVPIPSGGAKLVQLLDEKLIGSLNASAEDATVLTTR